MKYLLTLLLFFTTSLSAGGPAAVVILRHAEKAPKGDFLDQKGRERAAALAPFFIGSEWVFQFGTPISIYAQRPDKEHSSQRPIETMNPLANALNIQINTQYTRELFPQMVTEILLSQKYEGKMVLICWEHDDIPDIARMLGAAEAPKKWKSKAFDRLWILKFVNGAVQFEDQPQSLMYGDSSH